MHPIDFPEANVKIAEKQDEYLTLPALQTSRAEGREGYVISCWKLTFWERIKILFTGKLWVSILTFHKPLQPMLFTVEKDELILPKNQRNQRNL